MTRINNYLCISSEAIFRFSSSFCSLLCLSVCLLSLSLSLPKAVHSHPITIWKEVKKKNQFKKKKKTNLLVERTGREQQSKALVAEQPVDKFSPPVFEPRVSSPVISPVKPLLANYKWKPKTLEINLYLRF